MDTMMYIMIYYIIHNNSLWAMLWICEHFWGKGDNFSYVKTWFLKISFFHTFYKI